MEEVATEAGDTDSAVMDSAATEAEVAVAILRLTRLAIPLAGSSVVTAGNPKALR